LQDGPNGDVIVGDEYFVIHKLLFLLANLRELTRIQVVGISGEREPLSNVLGSLSRAIR
jgi:hypothetical protein